jgi:hypothetical protein
MLTADQIVNNAACSATSGAFQQFLCGWQGVMAIALTVSAVFLAAFYILSVLMRNDSLKGFVKIELSELAITAVLVMILVGAIGAVSDLQFGSLISSQNVIGVTSSASIYNVTQTYFENVGGDMSSWLEMDYVLGVVVDSFASVQSQPRPMGVGIVAPPFAGLASPIKQLLYSMSNALAIAYVINYAQLYVFLFVLQGALRYYIPLGIILRSLTPTRRIGGALIGLGVSFLFVFPALYSVNCLMFYNGSGPMETFRSFTASRFDMSGGLGSLIKGFYDSHGSMGAVDMVVTTIGAMGQIFATIVGEIFTFAMVLPVSVIGRAFVIGFLMPVFDILLMVQVTSALSKSMGEEVDISTLTRMV